MKKQYIIPKIKIQKLLSIEHINAGSFGGGSSTSKCNCHGSDCGCGMSVCHNPNVCSNGCGNKSHAKSFYGGYSDDDIW